MTWDARAIGQRVAELGPWFHNMDLNGVQTAPGHFLGDFPAVKWRSFADTVPADLSGKTVLDIGCNGGFYAMEMKRRGADRVVAIDVDDTYLAQARFAAEVRELSIEFRLMSVYDVAALGERFDIVFFIGVLYHLRHPLLALDLIHRHVTRDMLIFQSMQRGSSDIAAIAADYDFWDMAHFDQPGYPKLHFIEHSYAHDDTNWWAPNRAASAAMLRAAGFIIEATREDEIFICRHGPGGAEPIYPSRGGKP